MNVEQMPDAIRGRPTLAFVGDHDPLLAALRQSIIRHANEARVTMRRAQNCLVSGGVMPFPLGER